MTNWKSIEKKRKRGKPSREQSILAVKLADMWRIPKIADPLRIARWTVQRANYKVSQIKSFENVE